MREEVRAALAGLVAALEAHAEAAAAVSRPDIPDPLPQANEDLAAAVVEYRRVVEHWTGAHVPLVVPEPPVGDPPAPPGADLPATGGGDEEPAPHIDDVDWAGDAERWR